MSSRQKYLFDCCGELEKEAIFHVWAILLPVQKRYSFIQRKVIFTFYVLQEYSKTGISLPGQAAVWLAPIKVSLFL